MRTQLPLMYLFIIVAAILFIIAYTYVINLDNFWWKKIIKATIVSVGTIIIYATFYQWGMATFEGVDKSFLQSIQVVVESITTAGYGGDSPWQSTEMNTFVLLMNMTGVVMVFFAVPLFVVPLIREALERGAPTEISLSGHVIICSQTTKSAVLKQELSSKSIPFVLVETDPEIVIKLHKRGVNAVLGDPSQENVLNNVSVEYAQAIVADMDDEKNSIIALTAKKLNPDIQIITIAKNQNTERYHRYAGATEVILPRNVLGTSLANKALVTISNDLQSITKLGNEMEIAELLVEPGSEIEGQTLFGSGLLNSRPPSLIGVWVDGVFEPVPEREQKITENTILLVIGTHDELLDFRRRTVSPDKKECNSVIVAGYGAVGRSIVQRLQAKESDFTVIDQKEHEGLDVVGDITREEILEKAGIEQASAIILAMNDDSTAIYASLIIKNLSPDTKIIARVNDINNAENLYRAGADYVLSLATVSGRMIFSLLVKSDLVLSSDTTYEVIRTKAAKLVGITPNVDKIRRITGATIVAIERKGKTIYEIDENIEIEPEDTIIIVGSDETVNQFRKTYC